MYIKVIMGCMFAQKSEHALLDYYQKNWHYKVGYFKATIKPQPAPVVEGTHATHDRTVIGTNFFTVRPDFDFAHMDAYEYNILDEFQFLPPGSALRLRNYVEVNDKDITVVGLDMDFLGKPFEEMATIASLADKVVKVKSICKCGRKAIYSHRLLESNERFVEGAAEAYEPLCRECFRKKVSFI